MRRILEENINSVEHWDWVYEKPEPFEFYEKDLRYTLIANYVRDGDKVLDVGCGDGGQCYLMKQFRYGADIWGVDFTPKGIANARGLYGQFAEFREGSIYALPLETGEFDVVTCGEVLEHLDYPDEAIKELARVCKERLIITTPYNENPSHNPEHVWGFDGFDLADMVGKYFKDVWWLPWASGRLLKRLDNGQTVKRAGEFDIIFLVAQK
jgi:ubiquinone/menaquinone biosynthesis C-methylase UbiE